jgi:hypothetical protein
MNFNRNNEVEIVWRIYNCVKNMKPLRLHSDYNYFKRIVEGYEAIIKEHYFRNVPDKEISEKFIETLKLMKEKLETAKNLLA